ncbi:MAG: hypothetical protein ABSA11_10250 [Candidatus Bathyarchaeia archaeon]
MWNTPTAAEYVEYLYGVVPEIWRQQHPGYEKMTLSQLSYPQLYLIFNDS